jgi:hypothetical protein
VSSPFWRRRRRRGSAPLIGEDATGRRIWSAVSGGGERCLACLGREDAGALSFFFSFLFCPFGLGIGKDCTSFGEEARPVYIVLSR